MPTSTGRRPILSESKPPIGNQKKLDNPTNTVAKRLSVIDISRVRFA